MVLPVSPQVLKPKTKNGGEQASILELYQFFSDRENDIEIMDREIREVFAYEEKENKGNLAGIVL